MKNTIKYNLILFLIGFFGYGLLEITWRGYTHPTMGLSGGLSLCFISYINFKLRELNILYKALLGGFFITFVEFIIGVIFNIGLNRNIWDYSLMPLNLFGQICFSFSVFWCFISIPMLKLTELIAKILKISEFNDNKNKYIALDRNKAL